MSLISKNTIHTVWKYMYHPRRKGLSEHQQIRIYLYFHFFHIRYILIHILCGSREWSDTIHDSTDVLFHATVRHIHHLVCNLNVSGEIFCVYGQFRWLESKRNVKESMSNSPILPPPLTNNCCEDSPSNCPFHPPSSLLAWNRPPTNPEIEKLKSEEKFCCTFWSVQRFGWWRQFVGLDRAGNSGHQCLGSRWQERPQWTRSPGFRTAWGRMIWAAGVWRAWQLLSRVCGGSRAV